MSARGNIERRIVLASASPRRQEILRAIGIEFDTHATGLDEEAIQAETPRARIMKIAAAKAAAAWEALAEVIADPNESARLIIAADTEVILDGEIFGKPGDRVEAAKMLGRLSGRTHEVITALALKSLPGGEIWIHAERTEVTLQKLSEEFIAAYLATGEADDKAGAYGIQGMGGRLIAGFNGSISNVIGLPLKTLAEGIRVMTGKELASAGDEAAVLRRAFPNMDEWN